jgi:hypothetical protein
MNACSFRSVGLVVICIFAACANRSQETRTPQPVASSANLPIALTSVAATSVAATSSSPQMSKRPSSASLPSLLDSVNATLAVSSTVDNPRDYPEHLIDGLADTAWNSKTGDLRGYIAFRVPKDAHVDDIFLTVGFDKVLRKFDRLGKQIASEDLFTANHRITKVALFHNNVQLREVVLDPNIRSPQAIRVDGPGGDYKVQVTETLPGTKRAWQELVISEFRVTGRPGDEGNLRAPDSKLRVAVGTLDINPARDALVRITETEQAFASTEALCSAMVHVAKESLTDERLTPEQVKTFGKPSCGVEPFPIAFKAVAPYRSLRVAKVRNAVNSADHLVIESARGFLQGNISWNNNSPLDPGCPSTVRLETVEEVRIESGYVVLILGGSHMAGAGPGPVHANDPGYREELVRTAYWAKDDGKILKTHYLDTQFFGGPPLGTKTRPMDQSKVPWEVTRVPWATLPWKSVRPVGVSPTGEVVLQFGD